MLKFQLRFSQNRVFGDGPLQFSAAQLLVCVSCNVVLLWPNGWMDQDVTGYELHVRR